MAGRLGILLTAVATLLVVLFAPVDETLPLHLPGPNETYALVQGGHWLRTDSSASQLRAGWAKQNIATPIGLTPLAGYGISRGKARQVNDSLRIQVIWLQKDGFKLAIVSADLLIFPPEVKEALRQKLLQKEITADALYFSATHTHNGSGGWAGGVAGQLMAGRYSTDIVNMLIRTVSACIETAAQSASEVHQLAFQKAELPEFVSHRIEAGDPLDTSIRSLLISRKDSSRAILFTYQAHPTCISHEAADISRDYPGVAVDSLEKAGFGLAMFCAGAVANHAPHSAAGSSHYELSHEIGDSLARRITRPEETRILDHTLAFGEIPLDFGSYQLRINNHFKLRQWLFLKLFGQQRVSITVLRLGDLLMLGMPCDYAGELALNLEKALRKNGKLLLISSFNGGYVGYVTPDKYYARMHPEVREMNWVGPQRGAFFEELTFMIARKVFNEKVAPD